MERALAQKHRDSQLGARLSRRAVTLSLTAVLLVVIGTGVKLFSVLGQLNRTQEIAEQTVLMEIQMADLRTYSLVATHLSMTPPGAVMRSELVARLDGLSAAIMTRQQEAAGSFDAFVRDSLRYDFARLIALTALIRDPPADLPVMDIAGQVRALGEDALGGVLVRQIDTLQREASRIRRNIHLSLGLFSMSVLTILLLLWRFVLRPLSRTALDEREHARLLEDALTHTAGHDRLTGLPNRRHASDLVDRHLSRRRKASVGLLHIDLNQFRAINEELGHEAGDQVLIQTAQRLSEMVQDREFAARIGGDEFLLLAGNAVSAQDLEARAVEVRRVLREPVALRGGARHIDCMIGAVWMPDGATDAASLSVRADIALHAAVTGGDGPICLFTRAMHDQVVMRDALGREIRTALDRGEFVVFYQPQVNSTTGAVSGFEALIRWRHPVRGLLSPADFLDAAEEMGLADHIGATVLDQALDAWQGWAAAGFDVPHVAVNYSAAQLGDTLLADRIKWALERRDLSPDCLVLEVVETVAVDSDDALAVRTIRALAAAGFAIELDDFGTGHASIANIRRFGVSRIKIDRSFVSGIDTRADLSAMADAMVRMALALGVGTIAEGVETAEERAAVIALGCGAIQGFNIARPMPFEDTLQWLSNHRVVTRGRARRQALAG